jgi:peptide/nickel transport system permease protein
MLQYILKRILMIIPIMLGVSVIVFAIMEMTPGDPARMILGERAPEDQLAALRAELRLDEAPHIRFGYWLGGVVQLDLGRSIRSKRPVTSEIAQRFPATMKLALLATGIAIIIGIPFGVISAVRPNSIADHILTFASFLGLAMPVFWQALMMILLFSVVLDWFPASGMGAGWKYYVLPAVTLGTSAIASITRMTRSTMLETINQDYVRTARAKGVVEQRVIYRHALRNAMIPVATVIGLQFGGLLAGAVITETIFSWPGIGRLAVDSIRAKDFPVVQGVIPVFALTYAVVNLLVDVLYGFLDPRLRVRYS